MSAWTLEELSALEKAYAQGVLTVEYGDKKVTYRSAAEMRRIIDDMRKDLGVTNSGSNRKFMSFSKGLE